MTLFPRIILLTAALLAAAPLTANAEEAKDSTAVEAKKVETVKKEKEHPLVQEVLRYAHSFMGRPYRSGGKGPAGFDCSGFTSYVFRNFDISLGASSRAQYTQGVEVDTEDIRPGDLLFFGGRRSGTTTVGHVGIAVDVDSRGTVTFIHSANRGGIRLDRYPDGGYYSRRFIGARRVLTH